MTTTSKIALLLVGVFALLAAVATGWAYASESSGSRPDRPLTSFTEDGGGVSDIGILGDVNCDGAIDAIDALLILQIKAALIDSLPCEKNADVDESGQVTSIDAALILQFTAGLIGSLPAVAVAPGALGDPAVVSISSLAMDVPDQADVEVEIRDVKDPGLGAWTIDISYDSAVVTAKDCSPQNGSVCNPDFGVNHDTVRITGARAGGLEGDTVLGSITFTCKTSGISSLVIAVPLLVDATIGAPQPMDYVTETGTITCGGTPTPVPPLPSGSNGRMTGGGRVFTQANVRVTHGFTLHCNAADLPNSLEVNWQGNRFHLESLGSASCTDDPSIEPQPPTADFDTYVGTGTGRYNGVSGATAEWLLTDAGQPGRKDIAGIRIFDFNNVLVLEVLDNLRVGNHQAHRGQPKDDATDTPVPPTDAPTEGPTATPTKPSKPTVSIGSLSMEVGEADSVDLRSLSIPSPGLGAWTIDIVYDPSVVTALGCASHPSGVCSTLFNAVTIRSTGATAAGLEGNTTLAKIGFQCKSPGSSALTLTLVIFADATIGDPQPISANVLNGKIDCDSPVGALVDTDGDGCPNVQELGPNAQSGGQRNPNNPWDFYDTNGDGLVDLANDILGVILALGAYDVIYDRGPSVGPNPWNMTAPDGIIDLPNDVLGVIQQFGHTCA